jgi:hypothetical protein
MAHRVTTESTRKTWARKGPLPPPLVALTAAAAAASSMAGGLRPDDAFVAAAMLDFCELLVDRVGVERN